MSDEQVLPEGMKWEEFSGKIEEYMGKPLDPVIPYSGKVAVYINQTFARNSEDWLDEKEIFKAVNNKLRSAAKASAYQDALKDKKKEYELSDDFKRAGLIKAAVAAGFSQAEAEALAASKLG